MNLSAIQIEWERHWPAALSLWSRYTRLSEPRWCMSNHEAAAEQLTGSFAMIRLDNHAVVINLADIAERGLADFPLEVMGHEIGHHVYCPGDLADQGRVLARIRRGLPTLEAHAPMVANLYEDLFINDKLVHQHNLRIADIYRKLGHGDGENSLWRLYLRIYEILWALPTGDLCGAPLKPDEEGDAQLGARLIRVYGRDWVKGAGRFGALCLRYLMQDAGSQNQELMRGWNDMNQPSRDSEAHGLAELDDDEENSAIHPSEDPLVNDSLDASGIDRRLNEDIEGGRKSAKRYRDVGEYGELLRQLGADMSDQQIAIRYYRELAIPHLISFPRKDLPSVVDPTPEGLERWEIGDPLEQIDWLESVTRNPHVVPGLTTVLRTYGDSPGTEPHSAPIDLYVGIDCSGSMPNPQRRLSYPVLAGTIVSLSALRAGAKVMACLSGEPGRSIATNGFVRAQSAVMGLLTDYLGSGTSFGIFRLQEMIDRVTPDSYPLHILILTDTDLFSSLDSENGKGWHVAQKALTVARGGGTIVMNTVDHHASHFLKEFTRLKDQGWNIARISDWEEVVAFARQFSKTTYQASKDKK